MIRNRYVYKHATPIKNVSGRKGKSRIWSKLVDRYMREHREWKDGRQVLANAKGADGKRLCVMRTCPNLFQLSFYFRGNANYEVKKMGDIGQSRAGLTGNTQKDLNVYRWVSDE